MFISTVYGAWVATCLVSSASVSVWWWSWQPFLFMPQVCLLCVNDDGARCAQRSSPCMYKQTKAVAIPTAPIFYIHALTHQQTCISRSTINPPLLSRGRWPLCASPSRNHHRLGGTHLLVVLCQQTLVLHHHRKHRKHLDISKFM